MKGLAEVIGTLEAAYGRPSLDDHPRLPPLDELILTILSQNTHDRNRDRAWEAMRARYPDWGAVAAAPRRQLAAAIRVGGLAPTKSARIQEVLRRVFIERGAYDLDFLRDVPLEEAEAYLRGFKGVGLKTIRCVLLFSCGRPVIPVDTHIFRVGKRLGLFPPKATPDRAHALLQEMTPPREMYPFHVNLITHGRKICGARSPRCEACPLAPACAHFAARRKKTAKTASPPRRRVER
ncbi:MAG TPA: endonuclease III [Verrucomicrobiae bacterium]|nr:endonuclease III [Verrucomicrobiae bacterium]